jgi:hypothetical protein
MMRMIALVFSLSTFVMFFASDNSTIAERRSAGEPARRVRCWSAAIRRISGDRLAMALTIATTPATTAHAAEDVESGVM